MRQSIAVIGISRFGLALLESFSRLDVDVIAIDHNKDNIKRASDLIRNVLIADSTDLESLKACGISNVDHAIVAIGQNERANLTASIITINNLKKLGIKKITARADEEDYKEILNLVGADEVILPLVTASEKLANKIALGKLVDYFQLKDDFDIFEIKIPDNFKETNIIKFDTRGKFKLNILLIDRHKTLIVPNKDTNLMPGDEIFIFGIKKDIPSIIKAFGEN